MANVVIMPRQGQSVESCIITTWQKKEGDKVAVGDILFSYETDKSAFDEPSQFEGTVLKLLFAEGDVVPCLEGVCIIGEEGEDISALAGAAAAEEAAPAVEAKAEEAVPAAAAVEAVVTAPAAEGDRVFISPRAKILALKTGCDLSKVAPTGPHGRIIERDVNKALDAGFTTTTDKIEAFLNGTLVAEEEKAVEAPAACEAPVS
ncbi:MAG: E3 binding domain-containing protein, partial [Clostridia bacterium]|nr:E3 binding domain-containing protein [Clostridia bacterium]